MRADEELDRCWDACIIGSGASGAVAAERLAAAGLSVVVLEEGSRLHRSATYEQVRAATEPALIHGLDGGWSPTGNAYTVRALGGGTVFYAGISFRYRDVDLDASAHLVGDLDPRWPIGPADLRPWYDEMEARLGVARQHGADRWEPASSPPPLPPHEPSPRGRVLWRAAEELGWRPYPTPLAINSSPGWTRPPCIRIGACTERRCPVGAKADVVDRILEPMVDTDGVVVRTDAKVISLSPLGSGRIGAVEWLDTRQRRRHTTRARVFVLAANAVQSAALLLRSTSRWAPDGLGNGNGLVGRGLSFKVSGYSEGLLEDPYPGGAGEERRNGMHSTVAFSDLYRDDSCPTGLGGVLYEANPVVDDPNQAQAVLRVHYLAGDQPCADNRVTLDRSVDQLGVPRVRMAYRTHPVDAQRLAHLADGADRLLHRAGASQVRRTASPYRTGSSHLHGTCRAGVDPLTSVVDPDGRLHEADNVYVVDGGYFPFAGGVNPTLTIQANSLRISTTIAQRHGQPAATTAPPPTGGLHVNTVAPGIHLAPYTDDLRSVVATWFDDAAVQRRLGGAAWFDEQLALRGANAPRTVRGADVIGHHAWVTFSESGEPVAFHTGEVYRRFTLPTRTEAGEDAVVDVDPRPAAGFAGVVSPEHRNKGYGQATVRALLDQPELAQVPIIYTGVEADNHSSRCALAHAGYDLARAEPDFENRVYYWKVR